MIKLLKFSFCIFSINAFAFQLVCGPKRSIRKILEENKDAYVVKAKVIGFTGDDKEEVSLFPSGLADKILEIEIQEVLLGTSPLKKVRYFRDSSIGLDRDVKIKDEILIFGKQKKNKSEVSLEALDSCTDTTFILKNDRFQGSLLELNESKAEYRLRKWRDDNHSIGFSKSELIEFLKPFKNHSVNK